MAHSSDARWDEISKRVAAVAAGVVSVLQNAEEEYQELLEIYQYVGGTDTLFAGQLFETSTPAQIQIDKAADLRKAMVAAHELYQCMSNTAVSTSNRAADLRRMS